MRRQEGECGEGARCCRDGGGVCCYHPVPLQGSPLTARKIQGFVLKIKEKVQTIKSSEPPSSTVAVSSSCPRSHSCSGGGLCPPWATAGARCSPGAASPCTNYLSACKNGQGNKTQKMGACCSSPLITGLSFVFPRLVFRDGKDEECGTLAGSGRAGGMVLWGSVIYE